MIITKESDNSPFLLETKQGNSPIYIHVASAAAAL